MDGVSFDFSDVGGFFRQATAEIVVVEDIVGDMAVEHARRHGSYSDRTGNLRRSNKHSQDSTGLTLYNDADYASYVESKGYDVLSSAALFAEKELRKELQR